VELRALCNEVPRTPPGPEGSNGTGITSGAADHPEFLSLKLFTAFVVSLQWEEEAGLLLTSSLPCFTETVYGYQFSVRGNAELSEGFFSLVTTEN